MAKLGDVGSLDAVEGKPTSAGQKGVVPKAVADFFASVGNVERCAAYCGRVQGFQQFARFGCLADNCMNDIAGFFVVFGAVGNPARKAVAILIHFAGFDAFDQRAKFATPGKGLVYSQKQNEARAAIDDPSPELAQKHPETGEPIRKYPHLEAMIGIWVPQNPDLAEAIRGAAIFVLGRAADFKEASARIERQIDLAKQRIAQATTIADVLSVPASILWDQP